MVHPVQQRVQQVNRRVRRLRVLYAVAASLLVVLATALLLGLLDYVFRYEDPGIRLLASGGLLAVVIWAATHFLWPGCRYQPSDLQTAQYLERCYPDLQNRLSSSLAFADQPEQDARAGSAELRRAVVAQATGDLESLDLDGCVDARAPRRMATSAAAALLLVAAIGWLDPAGSLLAARRLALPWQEAPWPRKHQLAFVDPPARLATGSDFEAVVVDLKGDLPESVTIYYLTEDGGRVQAESMKPLQQRMVHRRENVQRTFRYRAIAGDHHDMPWHTVEVIEPPRVESLSLELHPPAYTGWPVESSGENLLALQGTRVALQGRLDKPAAEVTLHVEAREQVTTRAAEVSPDGRSFSLAADAAQPWILRDSGSYWFRITDPEGLTGGGERRWNLRVVPDAPPTISLDKPAGNTFVTATAVVPIQTTVRDDLAIRSIELRFRRSESAEPAQPAEPAQQAERAESAKRAEPAEPGEPAEPAQSAEPAEQSFPLHHGPEQPPADSGGLRAAGELGEVREITTVWELAQLQNLAAGMWVEMLVVAEDYKPQSGQSPPRRLTIISAEELDERLAARQSYILGQLAEVLRMQQAVRSQTRALEIQLEVAGGLEKPDVDQLQSAELNQRQVDRLLSASGDGVAAQITAVLDELASNRVDNPDAVRRMEQLRETVNGLNQQQLPEIQRQLINALKLARVPSPTVAQDAADPELSRSLSEAGQGQDQVIQILEEVLGDLSQWDNYRRFSREIGRLRQDQEALFDETEQRRLDTLGQRLEDLSPQQQAGLKRQAERQDELARQLDKILGRMRQTHRELNESEPLAAEMLADALQLAETAAITGRMRESGRQIEANQVGQAVQTQQEVRELLDELLDTLANRREHELDRQLRGLDAASQELDRLRSGAQELREQLGAGGELEDAERQRELERLARQAEELAQQAQRLGRRLERLQAEPPARELSDAAASLEQAAAAGQQDQAGEAAEQAAAAEEALERAQQQLQAQRQQAEQDLFHELMARLQQQVTGLLARQQGLLDTTIELEAARDAADGFSSAQLSTVGEMATSQRSLARDTAAVADQVRQSQVFAAGFRGAAGEMEYAARGLESQQTGSSTQRSQRAAVARLGQLQEALRDDPGAPEQQPADDSPPDDGDQQDQPPGDAIRRLAELKLLRWMQLEISQQTGQLSAELEEAGEAAGELLRRLDELAAEQGRVADLMLDLSQ